MLAIASGKGGCGKTTTAVGLARALHHNGERPLVADADHEMPDLHLVTDTPRKPGLPALATGAAPTSVAHTPPDSPGIAVVPAAGSTADTVPVSLDRLRRWKGPVLLDCPAGAARDAAVPLRIADRTLLVTNPDPETLRDTAKTAEMARTLGASPVGVVLIDRSVEGTEPGTVVPDVKARELFGCSVFARIPAVDKPVLEVESVRTAYRAAAKKVFKRNI